MPPTTAVARWRTLPTDRVFERLRPRHPRRRGRVLGPRLAGARVAREREPRGNVDARDRFGREHDRVRGSRDEPRRRHAGRRRGRADSGGVSRARHLERRRHLRDRLLARRPSASAAGAARSRPPRRRTRLPLSRSSTGGTSARPLRIGGRILLDDAYMPPVAASSTMCRRFERLGGRGRSRYRTVVCGSSPTSCRPSTGVASASAGMSFRYLPLERTRGRIHASSRLHTRAGLALVKHLPPRHRPEVEEDRLSQASEVRPRREEAARPKDGNESDVEDEADHRTADARETTAAGTNAAHVKAATTPPPPGPRGASGRRVRAATGAPRARATSTPEGEREALRARGAPHRARPAASCAAERAEADPRERAQPPGDEGERERDVDADRHDHPRGRRRRAARPHARRHPRTRPRARASTRSRPRGEHPDGGADDRERQPRCRDDVAGDHCR